MIRKSTTAALVLSGVSTRKQAAEWEPKLEMIAESLSALVGM